MKKMVLAMCSCILLLSAHTQYVQSKTAAVTQPAAGFAANLYTIRDKVAMQDEAFEAAGSINEAPVENIGVAGINELAGDKPAKTINFEGSRGNLPWPVAAGTVAIHFGPYAVDGIKGFSDGIYINLAAGDSVRAVADGVISGVFDVDGSNAVIIKHGKYFTTYNNLEGIDVNKGDSIKAGKVLGVTTAIDEGESQLLFMVNDEKGTPLDPERWLKRI